MGGTGLLMGDALGQGGGSAGLGPLTAETQGEEAEVLLLFYC